MCDSFKVERNEIIGADFVDIECTSVRTSHFTMLISSSEKKLKEDHYLVPYALLELAMLFIHSQNLEEASNILDKSKYV